MQKKYKVCHTGTEHKRYDFKNVDGRKVQNKKKGKDGH